MANEIQADYNTTGSVLYSEVRNHVAQIYNQNGLPAGVEAYQTANIADYALTMTEQGTASKHWVGNFPSGLPIGIYHVRVKVRAGGAPAESDSIVAAGPMHWSGSVLSYLGTPQTGDNYAVVSHGTYGNAAILTAIASVASSLVTYFAAIPAAVWAYATRTLSSLAWIRWTSPLSPGGTTITTIQGDTYLAADGPIPTWTILLEDIDLTGATVVERIKPVGSEVITFNATVTDAGETEQTVTLPFATAAGTLSIPVGTWDMDLVAFMPGDSHPKFLRQGKHVSKKSTYTD